MILTARERQVVSLISTGLTRDEVAAQLGISVNGVKSHLSNAGDKLCVRTQAGIVGAAFASGELGHDLITHLDRRNW